MSEGEKYLTVSEVAAKYRFTEETIWKKCRQYEDGHPRGWAHHRLGRLIRFTTADLEAINKTMDPAPVVVDRKRKRKSLAA